MRSGATFMTAPSEHCRMPEEVGSFVLMDCGNERAD